MSCLATLLKTIFLPCEISFNSHNKLDTLFFSLYMRKVRPKEGEDFVQDQIKVKWER